MRFLGNNGTAARDAPQNAPQSLAGKYIVRSKSSPLCDYIQTISNIHMLRFKLKSPYLSRIRFSLCLLLLNIHFVPPPPKNCKQNHFAESEPNKINQLE